MSQHINSDKWISSILTGISLWLDVTSVEECMSCVIKVNFVLNLNICFSRLWACLTILCFNFSYSVYFM